MISAVVSARLAGLDRIKSGFTSRFANCLPIFRASRLPRSPNGRSLSGNAGSTTSPSRLIYEATRFHHATRRCGGVAPCGPHAADWLIADAMLLPYDFFG